MLKGKQAEPPQRARPQWGTGRGTEPGVDTATPDPWPLEQAAPRPTQTAPDAWLETSVTVVVSRVCSFSSLPRTDGAVWAPGSGV